MLLSGIGRNYLTLPLCPAQDASFRRLMDPAHSNWTRGAALDYCLGHQWMASFKQSDTMRLQQYVDYFLKGAAKPEWMEKGIPYLQKDKEKEKYKTMADVKEKAGN